MTIIARSTSIAMSSARRLKRRPARLRRKGHGFYVGLRATQSEEFIVIDIHDHETSEAHLIDADEPEAPPRLVVPRDKGHQYSIEHHGDRLIITTNSEAAEDFRIVQAPLDAPGLENWREIVPHKPGRLIIDVAVFKDFMARLEREDGLPRIVITPLREVADGDPSILDLSGEHTFASKRKPTRSAWRQATSSKRPRSASSIPR